MAYQRSPETHHVLFHVPTSEKTHNEMTPRDGILFTLHVFNKNRVPAPITRRIAQLEKRQMPMPTTTSNLHRHSLTTTILPGRPQSHIQCYTAQRWVRREALPKCRKCDDHKAIATFKFDSTPRRNGRLPCHYFRWHQVDLWTARTRQT